MIKATSFSAAFVALAAAAASAPAQPVTAESHTIGARVAQDAIRLASTPESPAAAFERLLAPRAATPTAVVVRDDADPLDAPFRAALWSAPESAKVQTANHRRTREMQ